MDDTQFCDLVVKGYNRLQQVILLKENVAQQR